MTELLLFIFSLSVLLVLFFFPTNTKNKKLRNISWFYFHSVFTHLNKITFLSWIFFSHFIFLKTFFLSSHVCFLLEKILFAFTLSRLFPPPLFSRFHVWNKTNFLLKCFSHQFSHVLFFLLTTFCCSLFFFYKWALLIFCTLNRE